MEVYKFLIIIRSIFEFALFWFNEPRSIIIISPGLRSVDGPPSLINCLRNLRIACLSIIANGLLVCLRKPKVKGVSLRVKGIELKVRGRNQRLNKALAYEWNKQEGQNHKISLPPQNIVRFFFKQKGLQFRRLAFINPASRRKTQGLWRIHT